MFKTFPTAACSHVLSLNLALRSGELLEFWKPTFWLNFKLGRVIGK